MEGEGWAHTSVGCGQITWETIQFHRGVYCLGHK